MISVVSFTFNPFQENTYILYDETKECVIFDPGCYAPNEKQQLADYIAQNGLKPVRLINTHCHIDHVLGNKFVSEKYNLPLAAHKDEIPILEETERWGAMMGLKVEPSPRPTIFLEEGHRVQFGNSYLEVLFTPGHSPASLSFYSPTDKIMVAGDVLFRESIGRTDLPGGNFDTLIRSIRDKYFNLEDEVKVYPGHMGMTTIGHEKRHNPFLSNQ